MRYQTVGASGEWSDTTLGALFDGYARMADSSVGTVRELGQRWLSRFNGEILPTLSQQWKAATGRDLDTATWRAIPARVFNSPSVFDQVLSAFNKVNPIMIGARAAFLSLVRSNASGLATKLARDTSKAVRVWERFGGDGGALRGAITTGGGRVGVLPALVGAELGAEIAAGGGGGREGGGDLWKVAKPIIDAILAVFGALDDTDDQEAEVIESNPPGGGGAPLPPADDKAKGLPGWVIPVGLAAAVVALSDN